MALWEIVSAPSVPGSRSVSRTPRIADSAPSHPDTPGGRCRPRAGRHDTPGSSCLWGCSLVIVSVWATDRNRAASAPPPASPHTSRAVRGAIGAEAHRFRSFSLSGFRHRGVVFSAELHLQSQKLLDYWLQLRSHL